MSQRKHLPHMLGLAALLAALGSAPAHAQSTSPGAAGQAPSGSSAASSTGSMGGSKSAGASTLSRSDRNMLRDMAQTNLAEIEAGKLALEKTKNPQVKEFAQKMVDDHTKGLDQVKQVAQAKGVDLPTEPDAKHKEMMKKLSALSDEKFDRQYMSQGGVSDHSKADAKLKKASASAKDPDVKSLAQNMETVVDQHLQMAKTTYSGVKSGTATGASGTSGSSRSSRSEPGNAPPYGGSGK